MTTPYTYLIGWKELNVWYYGVRFAKDCKPEDLWNPYKTSSKYVDDFVEKHGNPDVLEIRKVFDSVSKARRWETKVLVRTHVVKSVLWINKSNNICSATGNPWSEKTRERHKLCVVSEETKRKMSLSASKRRASNKTKELMSRNQKLAGGYGPKKMTMETRKKMSLKRQGRKPALGLVHSEETKKRQSYSTSIRNIGSMWINDGCINRNIKNHEEIPAGFQRGMIQKRRSYS